jgi:phosphohistidine phosphatase
LLFAPETTKGPGGTDSAGGFFLLPLSDITTWSELPARETRTMKTLFLLRHAKAENGGDDSPDFDRALNDRGRKEARAVGTFIRKQNVGLDLVLSSPAVRARETTELVLGSAELALEVRYDQRIYEAGPQRLLEVISQLEDEMSAVLMVGHNPGLGELLSLLTGRIEHMATGTLAKIDLKAAGPDADSRRGVREWSKVLEEKGTLDWTVKPKELA